MHQARLPLRRSALVARTFFFTALAATAVALLPATAGAATITVCAGGCDYTTIQAAVNAAAPSDLITVAAGTYNEDVAIPKTLTLSGAGAGTTTISGPIGGSGATVQVQAAGVVIEGFTITRDGNNTTDWNNPGLNSAGVAVQGQGQTVELRNSTLTGNRTGVDINNSNGNSIHNNLIDFNRTGLIFRNQTDNTTVSQNFVTNNWTVGVLFLDGSGGSNSPVQQALNSTFSDNDMSGNWYGQTVDRQSGGSLPAPGTTNLKNFSGNWYGTASPVVTTANSAEPGYAAQIPVAYGGSATPPGGQPDIAGPASPNFDYTPLLESGTDTNGGTPGFQPSYTAVKVTADGAQTGTTGRIQEGVNLASVAGTVHVAAGSYNEDVAVPKTLTLSGAGAGTTTISGPIGGSGATVQVQAAGVVIEGFTITRDGNNTTDWNNPGLNSAGVAVQGQGQTVELRNSTLTGNRTGVDINNSNGNSIHNNLIDFNRTGLIFRNQTDNTTVSQNFVTNNWTVGVLFLDGSGGSNSPVQQALNSTFSDNDMSGNWYGQTVDRQSGGSLPAPGTTNLKNFSGNWYGTASPVVTTANSAEPGYAAQIPVAYGGSATPPGGQPDIAGPASPNFDYTPLLESGTDTNGGTPGFQPSYTAVKVTADGAQTGTTERIQEGVDLVTAGGTVHVAAGTYNDASPVNIAKALTLAGANAGISPNDPGTPVNPNGARGPESTVAVTGGTRAINIQTGNVTVDGLRFTNTGADNTNVNEPLIGAGVSFGGAAPNTTIKNNLFDGVSRTAVYFNGPTSVDTGKVDDNRIPSPTRPATGCGVGGTAPGACGHQLFNLWQTDHLSFQRNVVLASPGNGDRIRVLNVNFPNGPSLQNDSPAVNITIAANTIRNSCVFTCITIAAGATNVLVKDNDIVIDVGNAVQLHPTWSTGKVDINHNILTDAADYAIVIDNAGADLSQFAANRNSLTGGGFRNMTATLANGECNWWGSAAGAVPAQNFGPVDSIPWLGSSDLNGACNLGPTGVRLVSVKAARTARGVKVGWRTGAEAQVLGFNVYRVAGKRLVRVNRALVLVRPAARHAYSVVDRTAPRGRRVAYRIQAVNPTGRKSWVARVSAR